MRSFAIWMLLLAGLAGTAAARDESADELKSRVQKALPQDRPRLFMQIAEVQLHNADHLYQDGDVEHARAAVDDIVASSEQARDSATETKKHLKNVEITVRKIAERLRDIKRTLVVEDQAHVEHAVQRLEEIRTALLKQMFSKEKK
jgi:soluble cytochrome b562